VVSAKIYPLVLTDWLLHLTHKATTPITHLIHSQVFINILQSNGVVSGQAGIYSASQNCATRCICSKRSTCQTSDGPSSFKYM